MLKKWYEAKPFTFGIVFIILYLGIPVLDAKYITPKVVPHCKGEITDEQVRACTSWFRKGDNKHVRTTKRGSGELHRRSPADERLREQERAIDDFGGKPNK